MWSYDPSGAFSLGSQGSLTLGSAGSFPLRKEFLLWNRTKNIWLTCHCFLVLSVKMSKYDNSSSTMSPSVDRKGKQKYAVEALFPYTLEIHT